MERNHITKVEFTFTEPLLGSLSGNSELMEDFITSKAPPENEAEEIEAISSIPETLQKATTFLARDKDGTPMLWDYQVKGFFKAAAEALINSGQVTEAELKRARLTRWTYKKTIDQQLFITPRRIRLQLPKDGKVIFFSRPLRAMTMHGERIALARSEQAPEGTKFICEIIVLNSTLQKYIKGFLDYAGLCGFGQWRNSGMGRVSWKEIKDRQ